MQETTARSALPAGTPVGIKCPTRIITYGWGEHYVGVLLTFTLPALLAPGNLPYVASALPCDLVILTQRRYFSRFNSHPTVARIRKFCPVRLVRLDDLIVSEDKYGMTLTYALHRAFSDLGPTMTEHWQIFLNADFILADGSLRTVIGLLARGERIVASPSYCTVAEEVIPELRRHLDPVTCALRISHRELARLILQHRHTVIRGKTVNQSAFHMRYTDQFYWSVDEGTLLGYQMPVSIVGLRPQRYVPEPNSHWDFGLIWEYCPDAEVCVIGDSDEFTMLELRNKSVAEDQVVAGPPDKRALAELMVTWVTPYQQHFVKFPLTLHDGDLPRDVEEARGRLWAFVDEVLSKTPPLPSHIKHSQWEYHYGSFHDARRISSRIQHWLRTKLQRLRTRLQELRTNLQDVVLLAAVSIAGSCRRVIASFWYKTLASFWPKITSVWPRAGARAKQVARPIVRFLLDRWIRPALRWIRLEIVQSDTLLDLSKRALELPYREAEIIVLKQEQAQLKQEQAQLEQQHTRLGQEHAQLEQQHTRLGQEHAQLKQEQAICIADLKNNLAAVTENVTALCNFATEHQLSLKHSYDYQLAIAQEQLRPGGSNLDREFFGEYHRCREYSIAPWKTLYEIHRTSSSRYRYATDSGVYLAGVDTSHVGVRVPVAVEEVGNPSVFLILGQSNGANHGETRSTAARAVFNFNPFDGLCYRASDPLLGATGDGGSPWCILGDALIADGFAQSILFCPLTIGGSTVKEWAPGGTYQHRMRYGISELRKAGFEPSYVLWHQGEADALYGTTADEYTEAFRDFVDSLRDNNVRAPIYVAIASYFAVPEGHQASQGIIRRAQQSLINPQQGIFAGPDTDVIRDRFDGCHMGGSGLRQHAQLWRVALLERARS